MKMDVGVTLIVFSLICILSFGIVSAGWFNDLFGKITGQDTTNPEGSFGQSTSAASCSGDISVYCHGFDQAYSSGGAECDADPLCQWSDYDSWCQPKNANYCGTLTTQTSCQ